MRNENLKKLAIALGLAVIPIAAIGIGSATNPINLLVDSTNTTSPTASPTASPTNTATVSPTVSPTTSPTTSPTVSPTTSPTDTITVSPTATATVSPTVSPTTSPTETPTYSPTVSPTKTASPTVSPTYSPSPTPTWSDRLNRRTTRVYAVGRQTYTPNGGIRDTMHYSPGLIIVRQGSWLQLSDRGTGEAHTFTLVDRSKVPRTFDQAINPDSFITNIQHSHNNGSTQVINTGQTGLDAVGDSIYYGPDDTVHIQITAQPGTYYFVCSLHPWMNGKLVVTR